MSKETYKKRWNHERYRVAKKNNGVTASSRRKVALAALEEDLKTGRLRVASKRSDVPLNDVQIERIKKEILNIKAKT